MTLGGTSDFIVAIQLPPLGGSNSFDCMTDSPKISFVIPTLDEEEGIIHTLSSIPFSQLSQHNYPCEIIVVDGGSIDKTIINALKYGAKIIRAPKGYGLSYQEGFKAAKGDIIITGDADGTYPFEKTISYLCHLENNELSFLHINRFADMEQGAMLYSNRIGNKILTFFTNLLFGLHLKDSQSGMWVFRKSALKNLTPQTVGMSFSQEIKINSFQNIPSQEIPGSYKRRLGKSKLYKWKDGYLNLKALFVKRFFGLYRYFKEARY